MGAWWSVNFFTTLLDHDLSDLWDHDIPQHYRDHGQEEVLLELF